MSSKISLLNVSLAIYIGFVLNPKKHKYLNQIKYRSSASRTRVERVLYFGYYSNH